MDNRVEHARMIGLRNALVVVIRKHKGSSTEVVNVMLRLLAEALDQTTTEYCESALKEFPLIIKEYLKDLEEERMSA